MWCDEIGRIVDDYGVKELQNVLPLITDSLFELNAQVNLLNKNMSGSILKDCLGGMESENTDKD